MTEGHRTRIAELLTIFAGRDELPNIGQISARDQRRLTWGVRHGLVRAERALWPWRVVGCCTKTWYVRVGI